MVKSIATELLELYGGSFPGEVNEFPSECVPGQAMSAKEAVMRADRGLPVTGVAELGQMPYDGVQHHNEKGEYLGEDIDMDNFEQMPIFSDPMDVMDYEDALSRRIQVQRPTPPPVAPTPTPQPSAAPEPDTQPKSD